MANILLISVQEDAPRTHALAQRFRATGFSVREGVSSDAALRAAAAGVLLWSQESREEPLFQDTARRVVSAGKAVVARLTDTLPAEGFGMLRAFDLSQWRGDPQDPLLDKLHDTVRQMVVRDLCAQAEHWRAISGGNDASAFSEYLTRYGPESAFAALAQWRLHRLAAGEPLAQPRTASQARGFVAAPAPRASANRFPPALSPSRVIDAGGRDVSHPRASQRRERRVSRLRGAMIMTMIPFLVGIALGGALSFNGAGGPTNLLGPAETLAAPIDAGARRLDAPAPAALAAVPEAWLSSLALVSEAESERAPTAAPASAESVPSPITSWAGNDTPTEPTLLAVAPLTPAISSEAVAAAAPEPVSPPQSAAAKVEAVAQAALGDASVGVSPPPDSIADAAAQGSDSGQDVAALIQEGMALILKVDDVRSGLSRLEPR